MGSSSEIVADDRRHVGVDRLVVGDAGADGVRQDHVAGAIGVEQSRHAQVRIAAETERIEKVVVDAPVDHIHALQSGGGAHVDDVVVHQQIAAFDQLDAHLLRQKRVFEVCRIEYARRQQHHRRLMPRRGVAPDSSARSVASSACA